MAHFAQIDENNVVTQVIVVGNKDCLNENGEESESVGIAFCKTLIGSGTRWVQTSYNARFRCKYANKGDIYDPETDCFVSPEPITTPSDDN